MKPCIIVLETNLKKALSIIDKFEIAEIRLDICEYNTAQIREMFSYKKGLIATYRTDSEKLLNYKIDILKKAMEYGASYIDLEYELDKEIIYEMCLYAKNYNTKVIISHHNPNETPSNEELQEIIDNSKKKGASLVKIVTKANSNEDAIRLFELYKNNDNLIAYSMGEAYRFTRITSLFLGAPFNYVSFGNKHITVEGQLSHREFSNIMENLTASRRM